MFYSSDISQRPKVIHIPFRFLSIVAKKKLRAQPEEEESH